MKTTAPAANQNLDQHLRIRIFKSLANPIRLDIIDELRKESQTVSDLVLNTGHEQSHISHNLRALEKGCCVIRKRQGKSTLYALNIQTILPMVILADEHANAHPFASLSAHTHTDTCNACDKIPHLAIQGKSTTHLLKSHTCNCKACRKNTTAIAKKKDVSALNNDHACGCAACAENQYFSLKHLARNPLLG